MKCLPPRVRLIGQLTFHALDSESRNREVTGVVYNRSMKRLALSLLGGFLLPFLYSLVVAPLTPYFKNYRTLDFLVAVPVRWPILILDALGVSPFEGEGALLLYLVSCNVIFYGSLIYFVLFALSKRTHLHRLPPAPTRSIQPKIRVRHPM